MYASEKDNTEIVKLLLEQKGIDINAKDVCFFHPLLVSIFFCFKIIFGFYSNSLKQHLWWHL